jgi:hypothetical protein
MESPQDSPTPSPAAGTPENRHDIRQRWGADRDRLLMVAGYADALTDAIRLVDRAFGEADTLVTDARREAEAIRAEAQRAADAVTGGLHSEVASLQSEVERLQAEIAQLESKRSVAKAMTAFDPAPPAVRAAPRGYHFGRELPRAAEPVDPLATFDLHPAGAPSGRRGVLARRAGIASVVIAVGAAAVWLVGMRAAPGRFARVASTALPSSGPAPTPTSSRSLPSTPPPAASAPEAPASAPAAVSVSIRAARPSWIRTGVDGVFDHGGFIAAGQQRVITGTREVEVRTGDGGALLVAVNGGPETVLGSNGADATKKWSLGGPEQPSHEAPPASSARAGDAAPSAGRSAVATMGVDSQPPASGPPRDQITAAEGRWFDAWYRSDDAALRTLQTTEFELVDQRPAAARPGRGVRVERAVRALQVDTWGDHAAASGVMIERVREGAARDLTSVFAETWVHRDGRWQLMGLRLTTPGETAAR